MKKRRAKPDVREQFVLYLQGISSSLKKTLPAKDHKKLQKELNRLVRKKEFKIGVAACALIVFSLAALYGNGKPEHSPAKKLADISDVKKVSPTPTPIAGEPATAPALSSETPQQEITQSSPTVTTASQQISPEEESAEKKQSEKNAQENRRQKNHHEDDEENDSSD